MKIESKVYGYVRLSPVEGDKNSWRLMVNFNRVDRRCIGMVYRDPAYPSYTPKYTNSNGKNEFKTKRAAAEDLLAVGVFRG